MRLKSRLLLFVLAGLASPALATAPVAEPYDHGLRSYVEGRFAQSQEELGRAAKSFAAALVDAPTDPVLQRRAFELAIAAGDQALAFRMATALAAGEDYDPTIKLVLATHALIEDDWREFETYRAALAEAGFAAFAAPVMDAWVLQQRGRRSEALAALQASPADPLAISYVSEHRAHLLAADHKWREASELYAVQLAGGGGDNMRLRMSAARALQAGGQKEQAQRVLEAGGSDPMLEAALKALAADKPISGGPADMRDGIATLYTRMANDLSRDRPVPIALVLARLATFLAPDSSDALLAVADVLARAGQYEMAVVVLRKMPDADPAAPAARARLAAILGEIDRGKESLALLEAAVARPDASIEDWGRYGDALRAADRFRPAAEAYGHAIALLPRRAPEHWQLFFLRGSALEQAGDWMAAEGDLRTALMLAPREPTVLNYLGYSLLDRGIRLDEAQRLIEQAHSLKPEDGYIADSLGWSYYRAARYVDAVRLLEAAFAAVPEDPTIGEHLGDAYWMVGRRIEARHRWQGALQSDPSAEQKQRVEAKLDLGLDLAAKRTHP